MKNIKKYIYGLVFSALSMPILSATIADSDSLSKQALDSLMDRTYISDFPGETIDVQNLKLVHNNTDVYIQGPEGMDISVKRNIKHSLEEFYIENLPSIDLNYFTNRTLEYKSCLPAFNSMAISTNMSLLRPVGLKDSTGMPDGSEVILDNNMVFGCKGTTPVVYSPNGITYKYNCLAENGTTTCLPVSASDLYGNSISYSYEKRFNRYIISEISRNDGVLLQFKYENMSANNSVDLLRLKNIIFGDKKIEYMYSTINGLYVKLTSVKDMFGRVTSYTYFPSGELKSVTSPDNLKVEYTYYPLNADSLNNGFSLGLSGKKITGPGLPEQNFSYMTINIPDKRTFEWRYNADAVNDIVTDWKVINYTIPRVIGQASYAASNGEVLEIRRFKIKSGSYGVNYRYQSGELISKVNNSYRQVEHGTALCPRYYHNFIVRPDYDYFCSRSNLIRKEIQILNSDGATYNKYTSTYDYDQFNRQILRVQEGNAEKIYESTKYAEHKGVHSNSSLRLTDIKEVSKSNDNINWHSFDKYGYYSDSEIYPRKIKSEAFAGRIAKEYLEYDNFGNLSKVRFNGDSSSFEIYTNYKNGKPQKTSKPTPENISIIIDSYTNYDDLGRKTSVKSYDGKSIYYTYGYNGLVSKIDHLNNVAADIEYTYENNASGLDVTEVRDNFRRRTSLNARGNPYIIYEFDYLNESESGRYKTFKYDNFDRKTFESSWSKSPSESLGSFNYFDLNGRTIKIKNRHQKEISISYLPEGVETVDGKGIKTLTTYRYFGDPTEFNIKSISSPNDVNTIVEYNIYGNITKISQSGLVESRYYNSFNDLCAVNRSDVGSTAYSYDTSGRLLYSIDGISHTEECIDLTKLPDKNSFSYLGNGLVNQIIFGISGYSLKYNYDNYGKVTSLSNGNSNILYEYDYFDNIKSEILLIDSYKFSKSSISNKLGYSESNEFTITDLSTSKIVSSVSVNLYPNAFGLPTRVAGNSQVYASNIKYHPSGSIQQLIYGNNLVFQQDYDEYQRPQDLNYLKNGTSINRLNYSYDINDNLISIKNNVFPSNNINMSYDSSDRLLRTIGPWGDLTYSYDNRNNITKKYIISNFGFVSDISYNYDIQKNRLSSYPGYMFSYDDKGNVTNNGKRNFTYNSANQLVSSGESLSNVYDGYNRRVKQILNGKNHYSFYSISGGLALRLSPEKISTTTLYIGKFLLAEIDNNPDSTPSNFTKPEIKIALTQTTVSVSNNEGLVDECPKNQVCTGNTGIKYTYFWSAENATSCNGNLSKNENGIITQLNGVSGISGSSSIISNPESVPIYIFSVSCNGPGGYMTKELSFGGVGSDI